MVLKIKNNDHRDEQLSQLISWGHWFTLFNIILVTAIGSQYLLIADWSSTFMGRFYAIISAVGHFSFITFAIYIIFLFPLSFIIRSPRWMRIICVFAATLGITLLLIDLEIFSRFRMHLNFTIWDVLTSSEPSSFNDGWQKLFIFVPMIFLLEVIFSLWSWKKLRSLSKRKKWVKPIIILFIISFFSSHLIHIWADANFYRPITMQRSSLPLSYPMTARQFLMKYGFLDEQTNAERSERGGNPFAIAIEYPLARIRFNKIEAPKNILVITLDGSYLPTLNNNMPNLAQLAQENIYYSHHKSSATQTEIGLFSLFYGLDPNYYSSILANHSSSVFLETLSKQGYRMGFFSSDGFASPLSRYALLIDFTLPPQQRQSNKTTTQLWLDWFEKTSQETTEPWFSIINYQALVNQVNGKEIKTVTDYNKNLKQIDTDIENIITKLKQTDTFKNTVIVITSAKGIDIDRQQIKTDNDTDRNLLSVPFIMVWPGKEPLQESKVSSHVDLVPTIMKELLAVKTSAQQYSQGENLFSLPDRKYWIAGKQNYIAAIYPERTIMIDEFGRYKIYDLEKRQLNDEKIDLSQFLELMTENRRFIVTN